MSEYIFLLTVKNGQYVDKPEQWVNHQRGKNYIARLDGTDRKFGFKRTFLERVKAGRRTFYKVEDFIVGQIYEIRCRYYTQGGAYEDNLNSIFECIAVSQEAIKMHVITEEKAIAKFSEGVIVSPLQGFSDQELILELKRRGYHIDLGDFISFQAKDVEAES
jgi:hypothetical protein